MINIIWLSMMVLSLIFGLINGKVEAVSQALMNASKSGFFLVLNLGGMMIFWMGLVAIAEKSGLVQLFAQTIRPVLMFLFPSVKENAVAMGDITMNLAANMLGLGNAATPFGIRAMEALQKLNQKTDEASDAMCMLVCINNSSVQLIPFTVMAILSQAGGLHVSEIIVTSLIATTASTTFAILMVKLLVKKGY